MPKDHQDEPVSGPAAPQARVSATKARQGRMGKHTLVILIISLALAIMAGIVLGFIPTGSA
jgi:hypothetical protein